MVRGRRDRRVDRVGGARRRRVATPDALAGRSRSGCSRGSRSWPSARSSRRGRATARTSTGARPSWGARSGLAWRRSSGRDRARALALLLAPAVVVVALARALARVAPPRRMAGRLALPLGIVSMGIAAAPGLPGAGWDSWSTPDVLWLNAAAALGRSMRSHDDIMVALRWLPAARSPEALPTLHARPARPRSVLLIIDESVRAEAICSVPGTGCPAAPAVNALLPGRFGFTAMRALDSTTALSIAALMTGQPPGERRDAPPVGADAARVRARGGDRRGLLDSPEPPLRELRSLPRRPAARGVRQRHRDGPVRDVPDGRRRRAAARPGARRRAPAPPAVPGDRAALEHALPVRRRQSRPSVLEPHRLAADGPVRASGGSLSRRDPPARWDPRALPPGRFARSPTARAPS